MIWPTEQIAAEDLDHVLALQLSVAWAGEQGGEPPRLGWWKTDLVDEEAGGDLFARLLPRTAAWAGLQAAREAAIRRDSELRKKLASPDQARTLFHFGFAVDEQLRERLAHHKRHGHVPQDVFGATLASRDGWNPSAFEAFLSRHGQANPERIPGARKLKKPESTLRDQAAMLAAALVPLVDPYPLPFVDIKPEAKR